MRRSTTVPHDDDNTTPIPEAPKTGRSGGAGEGVAIGVVPAVVVVGCCRRGVWRTERTRTIQDCH